MRTMQAVWRLFVVLGLGACGAPFDPNTDDDQVDILGSGQVTTEVRTVTGFNAISVTGGQWVVLEQTDTEGVQVQAEDNLLRYIEIEVDVGVLLVRSSLGVLLRPTEPIKVYVQAIEVRDIRVSGAVTLDAELTWNDRLDLSISGASTVNASGASGHLSLSVSGPSRYDGLELVSEDMWVSAVGPSHAEVWARETLRVEASGAALIRYRGGPSVSSALTGGASVQPVG